MKYFNECEVIFNSRFGSGLVLAQNTSIGVNRNINSTYVIGRQNSSQMFKTKADETNIEFTYFPNISDPI
jgi:acyl-[acyl carrier protein]--UDP-N-acetylglucosamine O-acyltransferase